MSNSTTTTSATITRSDSRAAPRRTAPRRTARAQSCRRQATHAQTAVALRPLSLSNSLHGCYVNFMLTTTYIVSTLLCSTKTTAVTYNFVLIEKSANYKHFTRRFSRQLLVVYSCQKHPDILAVTWANQTFSDFNNSWQKYYLELTQSKGGLFSHLT